MDLGRTPAMVEAVAAFRPDRRGSWLGWNMRASEKLHHTLNHQSLFALSAVRHTAFRMGTRIVAQHTAEMGVARSTPRMNFVPLGMSISPVPGTDVPERVSTWHGACGSVSADPGDAPGLVGGRFEA
jgi:hypothetical protein